MTDQKSSLGNISKYILGDIGIIRQNQYDLNFMFESNVTLNKTLIKPLNTNSASVNKMLSHLCQNLSIPSIGDIEKVGVVRNQKLIEYPVGRKFNSTLTLSLFLDRAGNIPKLFSKWMDLIYKPSSNTYGWYNDYVVDMYVRITKRPNLENSINENEPIDYDNTLSTYEILFHNVYPVNFGGLTLESNQPHALTTNITFNYSYSENIFNGESTGQKFKKTKSNVTSTNGASALTNQNGT